MSENPTQKKRAKKAQQAPSKKKKATQLGDFKLKKKLGQGGMGTVYLAKQVSLDRVVALKTLSRELSKREDFVKRFIREARSMAKLDHPNVVKVYAVDSKQGVHFAAIEYVDGQSAQDWLNQLGKFSVGDALNVAIAAATGLKAAHEQDMVHRDIKPDNILITKSGVTKVADFGLAKVQDEDNSMTQSGAGLGTPLYMAPEQARSAKYVDARSDIYALGATLYHMLTGELPFNAESALELIMKKEDGSFTPAKTHNADIPERLNLMIDKMLAKEADHRYGTCDEVLNDLASLSLANPALSFIDGAQAALPAVAAGSGATSQVSQTRAILGSTTSRGDAERQETKKRVEKIWYVQHLDPKGKKTVSKMATAQVLQAIKKGVVNAKSRAKLDANDDWVAVAQFPEFTDAIEKSIVRGRATEQKSSMANLYKEVERAEKNRHRWRFLRNLGNGVVGYTTFAIYLAFIAAVIALVVFFGGGVVEWGAAQLGLDGGGTSQSAPDDANQE